MIFSMGKEKSNEIEDDRREYEQDLSHLPVTNSHNDTGKGDIMQITLTKEQVKEAFGELRYMGTDYCYRYDKETRKKTEEVEALKLHLGSIKLGNSVDIRLETTELPKIEPYSVVELEETVYAPYVQRGNYPVLVERFTCKGIHPVSGKSV